MELDEGTSIRIAPGNAVPTGEFCMCNGICGGPPWPAAGENTTSRESDLPVTFPFTLPFWILTDPGLL